MENYVVHGGLMTDAQVEAYLNSFPTGYRFCPTDKELVVDYLQKKVLKLPLPANRIRDVNIYKYSPEELSDKYRGPGEERMYFFTSRVRKYPKGSRPNRVAGNGYWKASGADKAVGPKKKPIGYNRSLVYYQGEHKKAVKTNWIMHEFTLDLKSYPSEDRAPDDMKLDDCVLCMIYKKLKKDAIEDSTIIRSSTMFDEMIDQSESPCMQTVPNSNVPEGSPLPNSYAMGSSSSQQLVIRGQNLLFSSPPTMAYSAASATHNGISSSQMLGNYDGQNAIPMPESEPNMLLQHGGKYCYDPAPNQFQQYQYYNPAASNQIQPYQHYNPQALPGVNQMTNVIGGDHQMMNVSRGYYLPTPQEYSRSP